MYLNVVTVFPHFRKRKKRLKFCEVVVTQSGVITQPFMNTGGEKVPSPRGMKLLNLNAAGVPILDLLWVLRWVLNWNDKKR